MKNSNQYNIIFCGVGGQGVLKASEICGWAAIYEGFDEVKKSEVHGMSQRGGSVESHLRFGSKIFSPLIPPGKADFILSFNKAEYNNAKHFLKKDGMNFLKALEEAEKKIKNKKFINTYLLGTLSKELPIKKANWISAIKKVFSSMVEENIDFFLKGRNDY